MKATVLAISSGVAGRSNAMPLKNSSWRFSSPNCASARCLNSLISRSVATGPGLTPTTRMPSLCDAPPSARVKAMRPALAVEPAMYEAVSFSPATPSTLTMTPLRRDFMSR